MSVPLVVLLGWLCVGLEVALRGWLTVGGGAPSFVVPLAVVVALCAPSPAVPWTCLGLGLMLDLTAPRATPAETVTILGPHALGLFVAGQFVVTMRAMVLRRSPVAVVVLSVLGAALTYVIVTALLTVRSFYDPIVVRPTDELLGGLISAMLTGASAFVMSFVLIPLTPMLGLPGGRGWSRR